LRDAFGYDNSSFIDALKSRGFETYPDSTTPAARTELTLLSMLGIEVPGDALPAWSPRVSERREAREALQRAPATDRLRTEGYRLVHVESPIVHTNFSGG
jgi:hypothetical protein